MQTRYNDECTKVVETINKKGNYDLSSFAKLIWWTNKRDYIRKLIDRDRELGNLLEAEITGDGLGTRYSIKGKNIINFFKTYGPGISLLK